MNMFRLLTLSTLTYLLTACSPHPGAGNWLATGEQNPDFIKEFVKIEVSYEGRTDIFDTKAGQQSNTDDPSSAVRRCFWRGEDAQTIIMTCVQATNTDIEESYQLRVDPDNDVAELIKEKIVVGRFIREERPEEEHSYKEIFQPQ